MNQSLSLMMSNSIAIGIRCGHVGTSSGRLDNLSSRPDDVTTLKPRYRKVAGIIIYFVTYNPVIGR